MAHVLPIVVLLIAAGLVARVLRIRFENAMPIALMGIGLTLYVVYVLGILHAGFIALVVVIASGAIWVLVVEIRRGRLRRLVRGIVTPQVTVFVAASVACHLATVGATVAMWDELRLWGAYPKLLHELGTLQLGSGVELFESMQPYSPGMPLLAYFFGAFVPVFDEATVFFAYGVVAVTLLMPIARLLSWKRFYLIPVVGAALLGVPLYFWNSSNDAGNMFGSLFIDTYLGLLGGFGCYLIAIGAARRADGRIAIALTATTLFLFKDTGLVFGAVLVLAASGQLAAGLRRVRAPRTAAVRRFVARLAVLVLPLALTASSWKALLGVHGVGAALGYDYLGAELTFQDVSSFAGAVLSNRIMYSNLTFDGVPALAGIVILYLVTGLCMWIWLTGRRGLAARFGASRLPSAVPVVAGAALIYAAGCVTLLAFGNQYGGNTSYGVVIAVLGVAVLGVYLRLRADGQSARRRNDFAVASVAVAVINLAYIIGLFFLTTVAFQGVLSSFARYMSTAAVVALAFVVLYLASRRWDPPLGRPGAAATTATALALSVLVVLFPLRLPVAFDGGWDTEARAASGTLLKAVTSDLGGLDENARHGVFLVFAGDPFEDAGLHHRIYFDLLGTGVVVRNFFTETRIAVEADHDHEPTAADIAAARRWFIRTIDNATYEYVYIVEGSREVSTQFSDLFVDGVEEGALYRIDRGDARPALVLVD